MRPSIRSKGGGGAQLPHGRNQTSAGRTFQNLEDLNRQALEWSTVRMEQRPQGKAGLIPAQAFEHERPS